MQHTEITERYEKIRPLLLDLFFIISSLMSLCCLNWVLLDKQATNAISAVSQIRNSEPKYNRVKIM